MHPPIINTPDSICEQAARLLFMNVRWARNLPIFTALPIRDQMLLLEESWRELFILTAAQYELPIELGHLLSSTALSSDTERILPLLQDIKLFQDTLTKFKALGVDNTEYSCLKAIILFKTGKLINMIKYNDINLFKYIEIITFYNSHVFSYF